MDKALGFLGLIVFIIIVAIIGFVVVSPQPTNNFNSFQQPQLIDNSVFLQNDLNQNCVVKEKIVEKIYNPLNDLNCSVANPIDLNRWLFAPFKVNHQYSGLIYFSPHFLEETKASGNSMSPLIRDDSKLLVDIEYDFLDVNVCDIIVFREFRLSSNLIAHFVFRIGFDGQGKFVQTMGVHNDSADFLVRKQNFYGKVIAILGG